MSALLEDDCSDALSISIATLKTSASKDTGDTGWFKRFWTWVRLFYIEHSFLLIKIRSLIPNSESTHEWESSSIESWMEILRKPILFFTTALKVIFFPWWRKILTVPQNSHLWGYYNKKKARDIFNLNDSFHKWTWSCEIHSYCDVFLDFSLISILSLTSCQTNNHTYIYNGSWKVGNSLLSVQHRLC